MGRRDVLKILDYNKSEMIIRIRYGIYGQNSRGGFLRRFEKFRDGDYLYVFD